MKNTTSLGLTDTSRILLVTLFLRVTAVVLVILTLPIRPTLPAWMLEWYGRISWPLLSYSLLMLAFHKKSATLLSKYPGFLYADLLISAAVISIGGSWRSSYFGYTITTIILFTIFIGRRGAYISALVLTAAALVKDPAGGLPAMEVFFVSDWDMRMGAALIYITAGAILGYFRTLIDNLDELSRAKVEETRKLAAVEEKTRMALELHDGAKQMVNAVLLKMNPLIKRVRQSEDEVAEELRWLWRGMNYLKSELDQVMHMLDRTGADAGPLLELRGIIEEEVKIAEVMTGFSWLISSEAPTTALAPRAHLPLRRFMSEAMMNAWKHSGAAAGEITIRPAGNVVTITITDRGKGFTHVGAGNEKTTGMQSLLHRARELNGRLVIDTAPGKGCSISLAIPVPREPQLP